MNTASESPLPHGREMRKRAWRWHFLAAFLVIPFVLWQSVTGTIYLWSESWTDYRHPGLRFVEPAPARASLDAQVAAARAAFPAAGIGSITVPEDPRRSTLLTLDGSGELPIAAFVDPYTGRVLGSLQGADWPTAWSRKLHGGWPLGEAGSWLLELGACWTIVMVLSGLYLWWPRDGRPIWRSLVPRLGQGGWTFWRDLHACVAVWFSVLIVLFLFTALPWTSFWGTRVLQPLQNLFAQGAPAAAGFAPVFASSGATDGKGSLQAMLEQSRLRGMKGDLVFYMVAGPPGSAISVRNAMPRASQQRYLLLDRNDASVVGEAEWEDFPIIAKTVATGVSLHEGGFFGRVGPWLNTLFASALVWMSVSGFMAWWRRKPADAMGLPPRPARPWPLWLKSSSVLLFALLPLLTLSAVSLWLVEKLWLSLTPQTTR